MLISTTHTIENQPVREYVGLVSAEVIVGAHIFKDIFASLRDFFGGRSAAYEKTIKEAKDMAIKELSDRAQAMGGHAVIGVHLDYQVMGSKGSMLMVMASGTAVKF